MTDQEKQNVTNILRMAKGRISKTKADAVKACDFDTSLRITSNEARIDAYFREQGIEVTTHSDLPGISETNPLNAL